MYLCFKDGEDHLYPWLLFFFVCCFLLWLQGRAGQGCMNCAALFFFFSSSFVFFYKKNYLYFPLFWGWFGVNMMPEYLVSWDVGT